YVGTDGNRKLLSSDLTGFLGQQKLHEKPRRMRTPAIRHNAGARITELHPFLWSDGANRRATARERPDGSSGADTQLALAIGHRARGIDQGTSDQRVITGNTLDKIPSV